MSAWMTPRRLRIALTVSLAFNLLVVGLAAGFAAVSAMGNDSPRGPHRGPMAMEWRDFAGSLPDEERQELRNVLRESGPALRRKRTALRTLRQDVMDLVRSPEPDREAIEERLEEIREITAEMQSLLQETVFDHILSLPASVRKDL